MIVIDRINGYWPANVKMAARVWAKAFVDPDDPMTAEDLFDALEYITTQDDLEADA